MTVWDSSSVRVGACVEARQLCLVWKLRRHQCICVAVHVYAHGNVEIFFKYCRNGVILYRYLLKWND